MKNINKNIFEETHSPDKFENSKILTNQKYLKPQLDKIRIEKHQQFIDDKKENIETFQHSTESIPDAIHQNEKQTPVNIHIWPARTCAIVGDSNITGIEERRLSKNSSFVKI